MITTQIELQHFHAFSDVLSYDPCSSLFFDIETTGLSPDTSIVFMIGTISYSTEQGYMLTSYFAETKDEEKDLILAFLNEAERKETLLHFNGTTFDIPFLIKKAGTYMLQEQLKEKNSIDLYQKFKTLKPLLQMSSAKQKDFERLSGYNREDQLSGKQMIKLYQTYLASKEPLILHLLQQHNHDDLVGMTKILHLCSFFSLFQNTIPEDTMIDSSVSEDSVLSFRFSHSQDKLQQFHFLTDTLEFRFSFQKTNCHLLIDNTTVTLQIPLLHDTLCHFFEDYRNYYYLPLEDQAIHKSVACFIDSCYREKARASNCYIRKTSVFLPCVRDFSKESFRKAYASREYFIEYQPDASQQQWKCYLHQLFKHIL